MFGVSPQFAFVSTVFQFVGSSPFFRFLARELLILILFSKDFSDLFFCIEIMKTLA